MNGATCQGPNTCSCHECPTSSYTSFCTGCSYSNGGCTLSCSCLDTTGTNIVSSVNLALGYGNGADLSNVNGILTAGGTCA